MKSIFYILTVLLLLSACGQKANENPPSAERTDGEAAKATKTLLSPRAIEWSDDLKHIKNLLAVGADINARNDNGKTALHRAVWDGWKDLVTLLIESGADIEIKDKYGETALHKAAWENKPEIGEILINAGADINVVSNSGFTPLDHAWL